MDGWGSGFAAACWLRLDRAISLDVCAARGASDLGNLHGDFGRHFRFFLWTASLAAGQAKRDSNGERREPDGRLCFMRVSWWSTCDVRSFRIHGVNAKFGGLPVTLRHAEK